MALSGRLEDAESLLGSALEKSSEEALIWSDVATIRLERGLRETSTYQIFRALAAAEVALELDAADRAASFNRALALGSLPLICQARDAWKIHLQRESEVEWRAEAEANLRQLPVCLRWAPRPTADLDRPAGVASRWEVSHQPLDPTDPGIEAYDLGRVLLDGGDFEGALKAFRSARDLLQSSDHPLADWAVFYSAECLYQRTDYDQALDLLGDLDRILEASASGRQHLVARVAYQIGLIRSFSGDTSGSLGAYQRALEAFRAAGKKRYEGKVCAAIADIYLYLGDIRDAWDWLHNALTTHLDSAGPVELLTIHLTGAWLALDGSEPRVAEYFLEEVTRAAELSKKPPALIEAYRWQAIASEAAGRRLKAREALRKARRIAIKIEDPNLATVIEGDLALAEARIVSASEPEAALKHLAKAIRILSRTAYVSPLAEAYYERGRLLRRQGDLQGSQTALLRALEIVELERKSITAQDLRISYFDRSDSVVDLLLELQYEDLEQTDAALWTSDRARARLLQERRQRKGSATEPGGQDSTSESVSDGVKRLVYSVLPDKVLMWAVAEGEVLSTATSEVPASDLARRIENLHRTAKRGLNRDSEQGIEVAATLYEHLIKPLSSVIDPGDRLIVIADGALHRLPFGLLYNATRQRRVLQDHQLSFSPSLQSAPSERAALEGPYDRILAVSQPAANRTLFNLPPLNAETTIATLASEFVDLTVLRHEDATAAALLRLAPEFDAVYFSGHSLAGGGRLYQTRMLLAPDLERSPSGVLYGSDLTGSDLSRNELVVLASCSSALGEITATEGVLSLSHAWLAAGSHQVIAALWDVEDRATDVFFRRFFERLSESQDAAAALHSTQVEFLEREQSEVTLATWGAFVLTRAASPGGD